MNRDQLIETMARAMSEMAELAIGSVPQGTLYDTLATAALTALEAAGMRVVPVEATGKMVSYGAHMVTGLCAAVCCHVTGGHGGPRMHPHCECREAAPKVYRAMVLAAQEDSTSE